mgnify:CR=1 FL=1
MFIVYTEIIADNKISRWFYGMYKSGTHANDVATTLNRNELESNVYRCVCSYEDAINLNIMNMPC